MKHSDSTPPSEVQWPPTDLRIGMNVLGLTILGKLTKEDTLLMDSAPKEEWPKELWIKLGFNPPAKQG